jgi:membrane dipeptidase
MKTTFVLSALMLAMTASLSISAPAEPPDAATLAKVKKILREVPLIEGHNDPPWQYRNRRTDFDQIDLADDTSHLRPPMVTDIPRLRAGCVGGNSGQFLHARHPHQPPTCRLC